MWTLFTAHSYAVSSKHAILRIWKDVNNPFINNSFFPTTPGFALIEILKKKVERNQKENNTNTGKIYLYYG